MLQQVETGSEAYRPDFESSHFVSLSQIDLFTPQSVLLESTESEPSLFTYEGENVEEASQRVNWMVRDLATQGQYALLGSREFRNQLEKYVSHFEVPEEQDAVRYGAVEWFVQRSYHRLEHMGASDTAPLPFARPGTGRRVVKQVFNLFRNVGKMQQTIVRGSGEEQLFSVTSGSQKDIFNSQYACLEARHVRYRQEINRVIGRVGGTKLIYGREGMLRERNKSEKNSNAQREKLLLLSLPGLNQEEFGAIVDRVILPPNASRADTGRVPAAILEGLSELTNRPSVFRDATFREFFDSVEEQALHAWSSPGDSSVPELSPELDLYFMILRLRCCDYCWRMT